VITSCGFYSSGGTITSRELSQLTDQRRSLEAVGGVEMNCAAGMIATLEGATHDTDGCELVAAGYWSPGSDECDAKEINCPAGQYASL